MLKQSCPNCGTRCSLPDEAVGKKARCQKCRTIFEVEADPAPPEDDGTFALADDLEDSAAGEARADRRDALAAAPNTEAFIPARAEHLAAIPTVGRTFFESILWTLQFPTDAHNLVVFLGTWVLLAMGFAAAAFAGWVLKYVALFLVYGYYCAFCFSVLTDTASGDERLPSVELNDWKNEFAGALAKWVGTWAIAFLPAVVWVLVLASEHRAGFLADLRPWPRLDVLLTYSAQPVVAGLTWFAVFTWPMVALCVAIGGFSTVLRPDLLAVTIIRTLPMYALVVALVLGSVFAPSIVTKLISGASPLAAWVAAQGIELYFWIIAMKAIGLYYHHGKRRFAWDWG